MMPLVSIVIPCFNTGSHVRDAIQSALAQSYAPIEVIVIDDGSTDNSLDIIRSFGNEVRWQTGPNRGACRARNYGIELARGEFIQFLDADDLLKPDKLERQVPLAVAEENTIVYSDYDFIDLSADTVSAVYSAECFETDAVVFVLRHLRLSICAPVYRREQLLAIGGFCVGLKGSQEFDVNLRLAASGVKFRHLPDSLCVVRRREGSISSDYVRTIGEQLRLLSHLAAQLRERGELTDERRHAFAMRLAQNGRGCLERGGREIGMRFLAAAQQLDARALQEVYTPGARYLSRIVGPVLAESLVQWKRRIINNSHKGKGGRLKR